MPEVKAALDGFAREHLSGDMQLHQIVAYRTTEKIPADLIVKAAHRLRVGDVLIGSNAVRVSRRPGCNGRPVR